MPANGRPLALLTLAGVWAMLQIQRAQALTWDEIEFFRATKWIADGLVPYRDYWEHHTPLQWIVFAPVARVFGGGAGVGAVLAMRWAQVPLWIGVCALLLWLLNRANISTAARWTALIVLLSARAFVIAAIQYRVDTLGNVAFIAGLALLIKRRWIAFGVVMSAAVLANMRLTPLVVVAALLALFWGEERWRWNARGLTMIAGVVLAAGGFIGWLFVSGAWTGFIEGVVTYNTLSNRVAAPEAGNTLLPLLLAPFRHGDIGSIVLWLLAIGGVVIAFREWRRGGVFVLFAILFVAAMVAVAITAVQYDYHLQTAWLLMMPLAALSIERLLARSTQLSFAARAVPMTAIALNLIGLITPAFGKGLDYQNLVMSEVDRLTPVGSKVWDGSGYALRREPAYRYWFLAAGVRLMAERRMIEGYDIRKDPPAAIIYNYRVHRWLLAFPEVLRYVSHHYLPLYRNLLLPGMSATLEPQTARTIWRAPASGQYDVWAGVVLAKHPWLARPLEYGMVEGEDAVMMRIPLEQLPSFPYESLQWVVDGVAVPRGTRTLTLKKGSRVELLSSVTERTGVMLVMHGIRTLCIAPEESFVF